MRIEADFDCTSMELMEDLANKLYGNLFGAVHRPLSYFLKSQDPREKGCLIAAENIFEMFVGDSPDYSELETHET